MIRRAFLQGLPWAGAAGLVAARASGRGTVTYHVKGFSCPTCAIGLDTLLRDEKGVVKSRSSYPDGKVIIEFDPALINEEVLQKLITAQGFTIAGK
jgi:Cu+-exporting ATPase